jgi:alpha-glucoside transport system substrate-binding protein
VATADLVRFDLSDLTPHSSGGGSGEDMGELLQDFLWNGGDPAATAQKLEDAAKKDFGR